MRELKKSKQVNQKSCKLPGNFIWLFNWEVKRCTLGQGQSHLGEA